MSWRCCGDTFKNSTANQLKCYKLIYGLERAFQPSRRQTSNESGQAQTSSVSISRAILSKPGTIVRNKRGLRNCRFQEGDATNLNELADHSFDLVVRIFGAMFATKPFDVAKEMVRVSGPGGRIVMGNWIPNDPALVVQILKISSAYSPPPPEGFISPMTWGIKGNVIGRFAAAGVPAEKIFCSRDTYSFNAPVAPAAYLADFRTSYGPTMHAFAAAEQSGKAADLRQELEALFERQNRSEAKGATSIPATFLRVTVAP